MKFHNFAFKNLLRSKTRSALTIVSVTVTTLTLLVVMSLDDGFERSVKDELVDSIGAHLIVARGGCPMDAASIIAQGGVSPLFVPEQIVEVLEKVDGVKDVMPFKIFSVTTTDGTRTDIFCGITDVVNRIKPKWKYKKGGWFNDDDSIILGADIAFLEGRAIGDMIYFEHFDREFKVVGILDYTYTQDDGMFFLPLKTAQGLIRRKGKLSAISLSVQDIKSLKEVETSIKEQLSDEYMVLRPDAIGQNIMSFFDSTRIIMYSVLFFTLLISIAGIANTMVMMVYERRKELAYLKCIGAGLQDLFKLILLETFIICSIGGSAGIILGFSLSGIFEKIVKSFLLTEFLSKGANIIQPGIGISAISFLIIIITGLIATSYPILKVSGIMPMEAIRNE